MDRLSVNKTNHYYSLQKGQSPKILNRGHVHLISPHVQIWKPYRKGYARNEWSDFWQAPNMSRYPVYDICRLQTADWRPQIADCKLKDTKTLPNKGDTIKNITSCESEKVAWEQGWYFCAKLHWPHFQDAVGYSSPTRLFIDSPSISLIALILYSSLIIVNW